MECQHIFRSVQRYQMISDHFLSTQAWRPTTRWWKWAVLWTRWPVLSWRSPMTFVCWDPVPDVVWESSACPRMSQAALSCLERWGGGNRCGCRSCCCFWFLCLLLMQFSLLYMKVSPLLKVTSCLLATLSVFLLLSSHGVDLLSLQLSLSISSLLFLSFPGEPDPVRGDDDGGCASDRQPRGRLRRWIQRSLWTQRFQATNDIQRPQIN